MMEPESRYINESCFMGTQSSWFMAFSLSFSRMEPGSRYINELDFTGIQVSCFMAFPLVFIGWNPEVNT